MKTKKKLYFLTLVLCFFIGTIGVVNATTESLNVDPGKEFVCKINLASGDRIHLTFVTTGQASSHLSFSILFPNSTVLNLGEVDQYSISFTSDAAGTCELHFDNTNSSEPTFVALNYEVDHYILGVPQMIFVLIAIAVLLMVIVTGYIIMGKYAS